MDNKNGKNAGKHLSEGFEKIIKDYGSLLSRVAATYEANEAIQQELYQEICMACWQALSRFNNDASMKTYLLKIAHNRCISHVAKEVKRVKNHHAEKPAIENEADIDNLSVSDSDQAFIPNQQSPEKEAMQAQKLTILLTAVRELSLSNRQIITLSMEGCSYQEISDITGLSPSNVGVSISRVKAELKSKIQLAENRPKLRSA